MVSEDVTAAALVKTEGLRQGLLDVLLDGVKAVEVALAPIGEERPRMHSARRHYLRVRAIGDLLGEVGWTQSSPASSHDLDVRKHGWAATTALERLIARQHFAAWTYAEQEEAESAGEADAARLQAEDDLALIQSACREAKFTIAEPRLPQ